MSLRCILRVIDDDECQKLPQTLCKMTCLDLNLPTGHDTRQVACEKVNSDQVLKGGHCISSDSSVRSLFLSATEDRHSNAFCRRPRVPPLSTLGGASARQGDLFGPRVRVIATHACALEPHDLRLVRGANLPTYLPNLNIPHPT